MLWNTSIWIKCRALEIIFDVALMFLGNFGRGAKAGNPGRNPQFQKNKGKQ